ncbi:hypothetical protein [Primorskyibacter sp. S87]|uniref:hypothetical protein n=1 Tax=Primorskyibacter sp. S87 TaxID=3415126 RepID=UPI003C798512
MNITGDQLRHDLPRQIARTRATLIADALAEGASTTEARLQSDAAHRRVYKAWLREFADQNPRLATTARSILKLEGVL